MDPSTNRVTGSTYAYDAAGNMTNDTFNAYTYDAENRITSVNSGLATYAYLGALRVKRNFGGITVYVYSGTVPIAEYAAGAQLTQPLKEYIYSGSQLLATIDASMGLSYQYPDHLSTRVEADAAGAVTRTFGHFPFGEVWYETGTASKWKFTTYERDSESGLDYADFRFYSSRLGRFMSPDLLAGSAMSPESLDRYTYAGNDPVNFFDPSGLGKKGPCMLDSDGNWVGGCGGYCRIDDFTAPCEMAYGVVMSGAGYPSFLAGVGRCWQSSWDGNVWCGGGDNIQPFDGYLWAPPTDPFDVVRFRRPDVVEVAPGLKDARCEQEARIAAGNAVIPGLGSALFNSANVDVPQQLVTGALQSFFGFGFVSGQAMAAASKSETFLWNFRALTGVPKTLTARALGAVGVAITAYNVYKANAVYIKSYQDCMRQ